MAEDAASPLITFTYQMEIMETVKQEADDYTIVWIYNKSNNSGTIELIKYMQVNDYNMAHIPMGTACQMKTRVIKEGPKKIYFVDLPRVRGADEKINELFSAIKEIKNGWVTGASGRGLLMEPPHVYIFSNEVPNTEIGSPTRWEIHTIEKVEEDIQMRLLTDDEVAKAYTDQIAAQ